jgi:hypothetical protein
LQYEAGNFKPIIFHDSPYPIDPLVLINKYSSVWRDVVNFGYFDPSGTFLSIFYIFLSPIYILTNNLVITQFVFLFIICNLTLVTSYHLSRQIGINKIFSVLAAILYLANPYSIFYVWRILNANILLYAALPIIFLSLLKIGSHENFKKYVFLLLFGEFLILPSFANPVWYISFLFVSIVLLLSYSLIRRSSSHFTIKKTILKYLIVSTVLLLPILGYLVSILKTLPYPLNTFTPSTLKAQVTFYTSSAAHMNLPSLFSLTGLPPLYETPIWFNYEYIYLTDIRIFVGLAVASIISIVLILKGIHNGINKNIYPFIITFVMLVILFSNIGYTLLQNYPILFLPFRDPYQKLGSGFTLVLIILFCYSAQETFKTKITKMHKFVKVLLSLIIIFPVIYWTSPFISGNFIPREVKADNLHTFSAFTDAPSKYMPVINYLKHDKDIVSGSVRVLVYPFTGAIWCENDLFWGNDILRFSGISTISTMSHVNFMNETNFLIKLSSAGFLKDPDYLNIIAKLGIKYILIQNHPCAIDFSNQKKSELVAANNALSNASKDVERRINNMPIKKVMTTNDYSLFEISGRVPRSVFLVTPPENLTINKKISFLREPSIQPQYQKISSTEYIVNVKDVTRPSYLVLAESYDVGWKASVNGKEQIPDKYHYIIDDFANAWYLNKAGNFNIKLYYQPQKYYEIGSVISAILVCCCLFYLYYNGRKEMWDFIKGLFNRKKRNVR